MMGDCRICVHAREHAWWGQAGTHCGLDQRGPRFDCQRPWTSKTEVHCSECHQHFSSDRVADLHDPHCIPGNPRSTAQRLREASRTDGTSVFDTRGRKHGLVWVRYDPRIHPFAIAGASS